MTRSVVRASVVLALGVGVALGATGCGYSQNWNTGMNGGTNTGSTLNWVYP